MFLLALLPGTDEGKGPKLHSHPLYGTQTLLPAVTAVSRENPNQAYTDKSLSFPLNNSEPKLSFYHNGEIYSGAFGDWLTYIVNQLFSCCPVLGITQRTNISREQAEAIALLQLSPCCIAKN